MENRSLATGTAPKNPTSEEDRSSRLSGRMKVPSSNTYYVSFERVRRLQKFQLEERRLKRQRPIWVNHP
jgi:hypothetical protein